MFDINNFTRFIDYVSNLISNYNLFDYLSLFFIFLLGITFGSFLTMLVHRLFYYEDAIYENNKKEADNIKKGIISGRSYCPKCKNTLKGKHLVPLFSYLFLGGKCGYCGTKIPLSYFLTEFFLGVLFIIFYFFLNYIGLFSLTGSFFFLSILSTVLFLILVFLYGLLLYDIKYLYLSDVMNNILYILSSILFFLVSFISFKLLFFIILFVIFFYFSFFVINGFAKLYFGLKIGFDKIKDIELIGLGDFYALINILTFMSFGIGIKYFSLISHIDFSLLTSYFFLIGIFTLYFVFYIVTASVVSLIYFLITFILGFKNVEQENTEQELKENNINTPVVPFLPGLIIAGIIMLLIV